MAKRGIATGVFVACALAAAVPAWAAPAHEGLWIGALLTRTDPIFIRVVLGGEWELATGRADFPASGERGILLRDVTVRGARVAFAVPGREADLQFEGRLEGDRIEGVARQGVGGAPFELVRAVLGHDPSFDEMAGHYEFGPGQVVLVFRGVLGPMFVDYRSGRLGSLHALSDGRYVAGPTLTSGYPVDIAVTAKRDPRGRTVAVSWTQDGRTVRAARRMLYRTEPAEFRNGDVTLSGTLLLPHGDGPHPAVVMIHGSGPATRDTPLPVADALARHGVAVLIHDKRGTGRSTGAYGQRQMRADGRPGPDIAEAIAFMHAKFEVGRTGIGWDALEQRIARARQHGWIQYVNAPASLEGLRWNWQHILAYDPRPALHALRCPVLALYGERDTIVAPEVHVARMRDALAQSATRDSTVRIVAGANHQFFAAASGGPGEIGHLREFAGDFFDTRLVWLRERLASGRAAAAGDGDAVRPDLALFQR